jgi:polygalacturonase
MVLNFLYTLKKIEIIHILDIGIDVMGENIHVYNCSVVCYDDAVAVKPRRKEGKLTDCSQNVTVENIYTREGVGMTIGSVPANPKTNCVRNVTFRNIVQERAIKGIYVKSNPGKGTGIIDNILYENVTIKNPKW